MMLVVDVVKGVQTQTAECLLIGELTCPRMVVVLNKTDLLPPNKRQGAIEKMTKRLHKTLEGTRCVCVCVRWPGPPSHSPDVTAALSILNTTFLSEGLRTVPSLPWQRGPGAQRLLTHRSRKESRS